MNIRRHIDFSGIVQGVGFRPYIYRLATEYRLAGTIHNTSSGVTVEVEGPCDSVEDFLARIPQNAPPLARITATSICDVPCIGEREFRIVATDKEETVHTLIAPDVATCDDCLRELLDPSDRRYRYPFINCTNCGPRFTITRSIPYDRPSTSMAVFPMCPACHAEYNDPLHRRFHAQPNACWDCGPKLQVWDNTGTEIESVDPIGYAISTLKAGQIVALKGLGGFHLAADATNRGAVTSLRERKQRVEKPFAIMVASVSRAEELCNVSMAEADALLSIQRPIVLLSRKDSCSIPNQVAPCNRELGVFLPYTPLHHLLFAEGGFSALVMTSGNVSEEPIAIHNDEARTRLSSLGDCFLLHNREILLRCDDSVVRVPRNPDAGTSRHSLPSAALSRTTGTTPGPQVEKIQQLRRSRGFVPIPVFLHRQVLPVLAVGGELKNTVCLTKGNHAFLSQHIGDLENLEGYKFFEEALTHLRTILEIQPRAIAYDLHPDYFSTKWALQQAAVQRVGVQHHHAHIASCMAENRLDGDVIGIALDGTGYGTDGNIWGGEVLIANYRSFQRAAHFEYVPMPGGAAAIREPWRMAVSYLAHHVGRAFLKSKLPLLDEIDPRQIEVVLQMADRKVNSPFTSSCGRLFDAVAALVGIRCRVNYEAQAAIELEMVIPNSPTDEGYPFELLRANDTYVIGTRPLFKALLRDLSDQVAAGVISARFHNGLVKLLVETANVLRDRSSLNRVCLSGGTFNNVYLAESLCQRLRADRFQVFTQREVPCGDGGLSLGQAMVAIHTVA
jgi:hydrogenase maturation protein HypF